MQLDLFARSTFGAEQLYQYATFLSSREDGLGFTVCYSNNKRCGSRGRFKAMQGRSCK